MSNHAGKFPPVALRVSTESLDDSASRAAASGRPTFDPRGSTVWEWKTDSGHYSRDVSTTRVQKLEAPELSLEQTVIAKKPDEPPAQVSVAPGGGFNPYDRGGGPVVKTDARPAAVARPPSRPIVKVQLPPATALGRLRAWLSRK